MKAILASLRYDHFRSSVMIRGVLFSPLAVLCTKIVMLGASLDTFKSHVPCFVWNKRVLKRVL